MAFRVVFKRSFSAAKRARGTYPLLSMASHPVRFTFTLILIAAVGCPCAWGFTPQSPEVREVIEKAIAYLATAREARPGGKCLIGLVFLKENQRNHPKVQEALDAATDFVKQDRELIFRSSDTYTLALVAMFLCELDSDLYRTEIEKLLSILWQRQLPSGAWTYGSQQRSDTSQSQYAILACWTAHRTGFEVPPSTVLNVCQWLVRTQDIQGGFGYQPNDPGPDQPREKQTQVRESIALAGLGSVYVCSTMLGLNRMVQKSDGQLQVIPDAFVPVPGRGEGSLEVRLNRGLASEIRRAINDGNDWYSENYTISPIQYTYYYLYSLERYHAFRELAEGQAAAEPGWYNDGVRWLAAQQESSGSWPRARGATGTPIDACFAVLFLQRNTRKAISLSQFGEGLLVGGRGLPSDTRRIRVVDGRVVSALQRRSAAALAKLLSDPDSPDFAALMSADDALLIDPAGTTAADQASLRRLARSGSAEVRRIAMRALATQRELDNVPTFIAALSSDDLSLMREARDALRQVSRKFNGFGLPNDPSRAQRAAAVKAWKQWYLEIRPQGQLLD